MKFKSKRILNFFWSRPDPVLASAGLAGERFVAKIRLALTGVLLLIPLVNNLVFQMDPQENAVGLSLTIGSFLLSLLVYFLIGREFHPRRLSFVSSCFDVTLVSAALAVFLVLNQPHTAVNSKVVFEAYFLAIGATSLRYDRRVCLVSGIFAFAEYLSIAAYGSIKWDLNSSTYAPFPYGMFSWNTQVSRLILIAAACLLSMAVVTRTQELLRRATRDPLTGLINRSHFSERIAIEVSRAQRQHQPLTVAMVDVDHFKMFNDMHGHA